jgi:hypothetical protein
MKRMSHLAALLSALLLVYTQLFSQWVQTNGPYGGHVRAIAVSGSRIFAGTSTGGVFCSTNNGTSWNVCNTGFTRLDINALVVKGTNVFAGIGRGGVFLSTNNGMSWSAVNQGLTSLSVGPLGVSGSNLFAGTGGGVFVSTNDGGSWNAANSGLTCEAHSFATIGTSLYSGTCDGVFLSTNNGTSWSPANTGLPRWAEVQALCVYGTRLLAGTLSSGLFLSTDYGANWNNVTNGFSEKNVRALAASGSRIFVGTGGGGIFVSTDGGESWTPRNAGLMSGDIGSFCIAGTRVFAGVYPSGVFLSTDYGDHWEWASTGLVCSYVTSFATSGGNLLAGNLGSGVFLSTNQGISWTPANTGLTNSHVLGLGVIGTNLFAGTEGGGIFRSTNTGADWTSANTGLTNTNVRAFGVSGANTFAGTWGGGVFLSTNNGNAWANVKNGLTGLYISAFAMIGSNIFAGSSDDGVFLSTNDGVDWRPVNTGLNYYNLRALGVIGTILFAGSSYGVFMTSNNGTSWTARNTGPPSETVVVGLSAIGTNLFMGTEEAGVFLSTDNGTSWSEIRTGLPTTSVVTFALGGSEVLAGTLGNSVWHRPLGEMITPSVPTLLAPLNGAVAVSISPKLIWNKSVGASSYRLQVAKDFFVGAPVVDQAGIPDTSYSVSGLESSTTYQWRLSATNDGGTSSWSRPWSFTTVPLAPLTPVLISPTNGATGVSTSPTMRWNTSAGAASYCLQVSTDFISGAPIVDQAGITDTSYAVTGGLANNTTYQWRVNATNAGGTSRWSNVWSFKTVTLPVSVERVSNSVPTEYALSQNFPNPFNPLTAIKFDLPQSGKVSLRVFSMLGKEVSALISDDLPSGRYRISWDGGGLASGVYVYRLVAGLFVATRKLTLLK